MSGLIPYPTGAKKLPRSWAQGVTDAANAVRQFGGTGMLAREMGPLGSGAEPVPENKRNHRGAQRPQPYEVRFDSSLNDGDGGWKIYLPTAHLLSVGGEYVALGGVSALEDANGDGTGWFEFDDIDLEATHVWLVVSADASGSASGPTVTAEFAAEDDEDAQGNVCIAELSYTAPTNSEPAVVSIKQSVVGAIQLGGADGASVAVSADGPFSPLYEEDEVTGEPTDVVTGFQNCYWQNGGVTVLMSDQDIPGTAGYIALKAGATPSTTGTATLECYATLAAMQTAQRDRGYFIVPLYRVASAKITLDMRRMPVVYTYEMI